MTADAIRASAPRTAHVIPLTTSVKRSLPTEVPVQSSGLEQSSVTKRHLGTVVITERIGNLDRGNDGSVSLAQPRAPGRRSSRHHPKPQAMTEDVAAVGDQDVVALRLLRKEELVGQPCVLEQEAVVGGHEDVGGVSRKRRGNPRSDVQGAAERGRDRSLICLQDSSPCLREAVSLCLTAWLVRHRHCQ